MRVASIQIAIKDEPREQTLARVLSALDRAAGSDLVLLPELWPCGYFSFGRYHAESETMGGPLMQALAKKAVSLRAHLFCGSFIERDGDDLFNTAVLLSPSGTVLAKYRKMHLFSHQSMERALLKPGGEVVVVQTPLGRAGIATCYDLRFPEQFRAMLDRGAEFFLVAAAWPAERLDAWTLFCRARALENLAYLLSCNCAGTSAATALGGHSLFVDPLGNVTAEAGEGEQLLGAEIDLSVVTNARESFSALRDRVAMKP
jgi:predicted amidohydrolase